MEADMATTKNEMLDALLQRMDDALANGKRLPWQKSPGNRSSANCPHPRHLLQAEHRTARTDGVIEICRLPRGGGQLKTDSSHLLAAKKWHHPTHSGPSTSRLTGDGLGEFGVLV